MDVRLSINLKGILDENLIDEVVKNTFILNGGYKELDANEIALVLKNSL